MKRTVVVGAGLVLVLSIGATRATASPIPFSSGDSFTFKFDETGKVGMGIDKAHNNTPFFVQGEFLRDPTNSWPDPNHLVLIYDFSKANTKADGSGNHYDTSGLNYALGDVLVSEPPAAGGVGGPCGNPNNPLSPPGASLANCSDVARAVAANGSFDQDGAQQFMGIKAIFYSEVEQGGIPTNAGSLRNTRIVTERGLDGMPYSDDSNGFSYDAGTGGEIVGDNGSGNNLLRGISDTPSVPEVPEPASLVLLGTGLAGVVLRRHRRHK